MINVVNENLQTPYITFENIRNTKSGIRKSIYSLKYLKQKKKNILLPVKMLKNVYLFKIIYNS